MGFFSFMTADTNKSIHNVYSRKGALPVALLFPKEFHGGNAEEYFYEGYGKFGEQEYDVFELIVDWNYRYYEVANLKEPMREWYADDEDGQRFYERALYSYERICHILIDYQSGKTPEQMEKEYGSEWKRELGIRLRNEDNRKFLKYDLKIVEIENKHLSYEDVTSTSDDADDHGYFY